MWRVPGEQPAGRPCSSKLHVSASAALQVQPQGVVNEDYSVPLQYTADNIPKDVTTKYPHLYGCSTFKVGRRHSTTFG